MTLLKFPNGTKPCILKPACQFKSLYDTDSLLPNSLASSVPAVNVSETERSESKKYKRREFSYKSFSRTFILPEAADSSNIEAEYTDGILLINIAKKEEAKIKSREISIK